MRAPLDAAPLASVEAAAPVFEAAEFEFVVDVASMIDSDSCSQSNGFDKSRFDVKLLPHTNYPSQKTMESRPKRPSGPSHGFGTGFGGK